jgi:hypothetical protein
MDEDGPSQVITIKPRGVCEGVGNRLEAAARAPGKLRHLRERVGDRRRLQVLVVAEVRPVPQPIPRSKRRQGPITVRDVGAIREVNGANALELVPSKIQRQPTRVGPFRNDPVGVFERIDAAQRLLLNLLQPVREGPGTVVRENPANAVREVNPCQLIKAVVSQRGDFVQGIGERADLMPIVVAKARQVFAVGTNVFDQVYAVGCVVINIRPQRDGNPGRHFARRPGFNDICRTAQGIPPIPFVIDLAAVGFLPCDHSRQAAGPFVSGVAIGLVRIIVPNFSSFNGPGDGCAIRARAALEGQRRADMEWRNGQMQPVPHAAFHVIQHREIKGIVC